MREVQAFPVAIIDEDYEGKSAAGRGMQQLAAAIEKEGFRVVAGVTYKDAHRLVKIFNNESCWLVSVDGSEDAATRWQVLEEVLAAKRSRNERLPIFLFGDELTAEMVPASVLKHANAFMRLLEDSAEFMAPVIARSWYAYANFHEFYDGHHGISSANPARSKNAITFTTDSTHCMAAAPSRCSTAWCSCCPAYLCSCGRDDMPLPLSSAGDHDPVSCLRPAQLMARHNNG